MCISTENPQTISNLEQEIKTESPLQFATTSLKSHFNANHFDTSARIHTTIKPSSEGKEPSRTAIFNKSFLKYIKDVYNRRDYAEILSQDGTHIVEFLKLCNELNLESSALYVGMRLFRVKMMACEIIDDNVSTQLLEEFPDLMAKYFEKEHKSTKIEFVVLSKGIEKIILGRLNNQSPNVQQATTPAVKPMVQDITSLVFEELKKLKDKKTDKKTKARLRFEIIRFFETIMARTLWNHKSPETVWPSFLNIANGLQHLAANNVISHMDDLDSLLWSLVHRFSFFLDFVGSYLPLNFYKEVETALDDKTVFFLESQEQDEGVKSKKDVLAEALLHAKAKAYAYQKKGIISQM
jgi:hypothetical protein